MQQNYTETHEFLVSILDAVPHGIVALDMDGAITMCNELALNHLNIEKKVKEVIETPLFDYLDELSALQEALDHCFSKGRKPIDLAAITFHEKYLTFHGRRILNGMILTIEDVTRAKYLEHTNLMAMMEGQESERRRLARDIHDGIGPVLSTIKLHLDAVQSELQEMPEKTLRKINSMGEMIHEMADDVRNISHALMPSALMDLGLVTALDNLCQKANGAKKAEVLFYHSGMEKRLDNQLALGLFRITQELLNNAFKYAQASTINVQLIKHPESVMLMVEDDGVGFELEQIKTIINNGIGLRNIRTRTKSLGGYFNIESQKGRGVLASVEIPINIS